MLGRLENNPLYFGVSKKCCPTCVSILQPVFAKSGKRMAIMGAHANICPSALPPGLPASITSNVVATHRRLLQAELFKLTTKRPTPSMQSEGIEQEGPLDSRYYRLALKKAEAAKAGL